MVEHKVKSIFYEGAIPASFIAESIEKHKAQTSIGGHSIFLGQVRADEKDGKKVAAIEYTSYEQNGFGENAQHKARCF